MGCARRGSAERLYVVVCGEDLHSAQYQGGDFFFYRLFFTSADDVADRADWGGRGTGRQILIRRESGRKIDRSAKLGNLQIDLFRARLAISCHLARFSSPHVRPSSNYIPPATSAATARQSDGERGKIRR
jgi:hypothetical protein